MRKRIFRLAVAAACALLGVGVLLGTTIVSSTSQLAAQATDPSGGDPRGSNLDGNELGEAVVAKISGLLDPVLADFLSNSLKDAQNSGAILFVLQIDSRGAVISNSELQELADEILDSPVPVVSWIGTSGAKAYGKVAQLVAFTQQVGMAPGAHLGRTGADVLVGSPRSAGGSGAGGVGSSDATGGAGQGVWGDNSDRLRNSAVSADEALELGISSFPAPTVGDFLVNLDQLGFQSATTFNDDNQPRLEPLTPVKFVRLSALDQLFHTVASPPIAYVLLLIGLWLFAFEFFSAGVGIAGATGAVSLVLACYGLAILPLNWWAVALLVFAMFAYCIDAQVGVPRLWTIVGTGALVWGTLTLFDGANGADMSWIPMALGPLGVLVGMVWVMPVVIRSRFSTPTIGREWMVGEEGEAIEAIDPDGIIKIRGTLWRARTRRAVTIASGEKAVVEELVGLTLMVEPVEGEGATAEAAGGEKGAVDATDGEAEEEPTEDSAKETAGVT